ncbi:hypothetical protein JD78_02813 [Modestobacter roseus]|uniref:Uncharacterized protein n=1 Tax=Modestobacter roseus TaxID=1181884 RepID=A0A562ITK1_9ACTN|nr:hypothetical protein JD78_02813 [Modestobacter roseus]
MHRAAFCLHQADHQPAAVTLGGGHEGVPRRVGEAGLAAQRPRVVPHQPVLRLDLEALVPGRRGHLRDPGLQDVERVGVGDQLAHEQRQVVGRGRLAGDVEPGRRADDGVRCPQPGGGGVHRRDRGRHPAGGAGQGVGRVVARLHDQRPEEQVDGVLAVAHQAHPAALDRLVLHRTDHDLPRVELRGEGQQGQRLEGARRVVAAVGVAGAEHLAGARVGHQPAARVDALRQRRGALGGDHPAGVQPLPAHGAAVRGAPLRRTRGVGGARGGGGRVDGGPGGLGAGGGTGGGEHRDSGREAGEQGAGDGGPDGGAGARPGRGRRVAHDGHANPAGPEGRVWAPSHHGRQVCARCCP